MSEITPEEAAQRWFYAQIHRLSPNDTWANLPEAAKEVFRREVSSTEQRRDEHADQG